MHSGKRGLLSMPERQVCRACCPTNLRAAARMDRAEIRHGDKVVRGGRPPLAHPKEAVKLRPDHDVLAAYRKTGSGWQTRINADLRKAAKKLAG